MPMSAEKAAIVAARREELRARLAEGASRPDLMREYSRKWGLRPAEIRVYLRKVAGPVAAHADNAEVAARLEEIRKRIAAGQTPMDIARELSAAWGVCTHRVTRYFRRAYEGMPAGETPRPTARGRHLHVERERRIRYAVRRLRRDTPIFELVDEVQERFGVVRSTAWLVVRDACTRNDPYRIRKLKRRMREGMKIAEARLLAELGQPPDDTPWPWERKKPRALREPQAEKSDS